MCYGSSMTSSEISGGKRPIKKRKSFKRYARYVQLLVVGCGASRPRNRDC